MPKMEIKGTAVIAIREYVKKEYARDFEKWMDSLSDKSKEIFTNVIDSTNWYPIEEGAKEPTEAIANMFFNGDIVRGSKNAGRFSADVALSGIYKIFVKATNPTYIIKRASRVFATYYRPCEMQVVDESLKHVVIEISKLSERYIAIENRIVGWCERALEISGSKFVVIITKEIREDKNGKIVEIDLRWD